MDNKKEINMPDPNIAGNQSPKAPEEETLTVEDITQDEETEEERERAIERDKAEKLKQAAPFQDKDQEQA